MADLSKEIMAFCGGCDFYDNGCPIADMRQQALDADYCSHAKLDAVSLRVRAIGPVLNLDSNGIITDQNPIRVRWKELSDKRLSSSETPASDYQI